MLVVVSYDVNTQNIDGKRRLRKIAKYCMDYGQRVQDSVFECSLDAAQYRLFQAKLCEMMDPERDSLRFYQLGNRYHEKIEHYGVKPGYQPDEALIL